MGNRALGHADAPGHSKGELMAQHQLNKAFVVYRRATGFFTIMPRGAKGWAQFCLWLAMLVPLCLWLLLQVETHAQGRELSDSFAIFGIAVLFWLIGGIWWMLAHAEVVDVAEAMRRKYMEDRKNRRGS